MMYSCYVWFVFHVHWMKPLRLKRKRTKNKKKIIIIQRKKHFSVVHHVCTHHLPLKNVFLFDKHQSSLRNGTFSCFFQKTNRIRHVYFAWHIFFIFRIRKLLKKSFFDLLFIQHHFTCWRFFVSLSITHKPMKIIYSTGALWAWIMSNAKAFFTTHAKWSLE